ncbi:uncharacterized protein PV09_05745 [Verruconis gallopava]|uniref:Uncharacterized protein n=1 Tax=Verruconis gallopava TaxID=253628 RepID=A0A0D2A970_9PEZI|nr:uncharacterized protein PV09_05745 [Verruconis gallopava]KIW03100.1 hypothetical protein PV09_05745 [Verruconis gallopava]
MINLRILSVVIVLMGCALGAYLSSSASQAVNNASLLFAWQLVSITGMGTPFNGYPCSKVATPSDMTCIVSDMLKNKATYDNKLKKIGLVPEVVDSVIADREGCAANLDTAVAKHHVRAYLNAVITALASATVAQRNVETFCLSLDEMCMTTLLGSNALRTALCAQAGSSAPTDGPSSSVDQRILADFDALVSGLFAWQLFGILSPSRDYIVNICTTNLASLKAGLDLLDMDVSAFTSLFCDQFAKNEDFPSVDLTLQSVNAIETKLFGTVVFGLSHERLYQCSLCADTALDFEKFGEVSLNRTAWENVRGYACGSNGYDDAKNAQC